MNMMSENINELISALALAQGQIRGAVKDSDNPFFKSKYADLNSIWNACREALSMHGLAVAQTMFENEKGDLFLQTTLGHSSGQWIKSNLPINIQSSKEGSRVNELQLLGSAITYLRRYALAAIVGVAPDEDDDGNAAGGYKAKQAKSYEKTSSSVPKKITDKQAYDLETILDECDPSYKKWFLDVAKKHYGIENISEIPQERFEKMRLDANKNREDYIKKQSEQYADQEMAASEIQ